VELLREHVLVRKLTRPTYAVLLKHKDGEQIGYLTWHYDWAFGVGDVRRPDHSLDVHYFRKEGARAKNFLVHGFKTRAEALDELLAWYNGRRHKKPQVAADA
jgi:hypothetical protein